MVRVIAVLVLSVLLPASGNSGPPGETTHHSTGLVVRVSPSQGIVVMKVNGHTHELTVTTATVLRNDWGEPLRHLQALQVGDYVREECVPESGRRNLARRIEVVRPAWRMLETPEY